MSTASDLIAKGKNAVEAELTRIEQDLATAKTKAAAEVTALSTELQAYLQTHATEVAIAAALIQRAGVTAGVQTAPTSTAPAATLAPVSEWSKIKTWVTTHISVRGVGLTVLGLIVLDILHRLGKIF